MSQVQNYLYHAYEHGQICRQVPIVIDQSVTATHTVKVGYAWFSRHLNGRESMRLPQGGKASPDN